MGWKLLLNKNDKNGKAKIIAFLISLVIVASLFFLGPVQAFILGLTIPNQEVLVGDNLIVNINAKITSEENLNFDKFLIDLSGPVSISCLFYANGSPISSCVGFTIEKISNNTDCVGYGYCSGYGYGYNEQNYEYIITINTSYYPAGLYNSKIFSFDGNKIFSQEGPQVVLKVEEDVLESCSIRAEGGIVKVDELNLIKKNKLSLYIPKHGASNGKGSLVSQNNKRLTYKFDTNGILENNEMTAKFVIKGEYKIQRGDEISENAVVTINKVNNKISIKGDKLKADNMDIKFIKGCK